jgi:hypothetical protein
VIVIVEAQAKEGLAHVHTSRPGLSRRAGETKQGVNDMTKSAYKTDRNFTSLIAVLTVVLCLACALPAGAQTIPGAGIVMTYNVNEGSDFQQVQGATTVPSICTETQMVPTLCQFLLGVGQIVTQVEGTNPPERMQAIAQEIVNIQPELLALQEVDQ